MASVAPPVKDTDAAGFDEDITGIDEIFRVARW